ncbi:MAG: lytic transglycosylase domain-containing protein [Candidatus Andeanibacterium colombiense]|uniref:Lytic transglycosylase domain-containing protein n=1 Tax=Candidatus Andeanibacterium colombiense TaxID=3121345 RepID=A0AAJ5X724_9SPHN|nr:MAG: lytic transglycosylase domain-containing protein [Sphingomonadaceae bacterium]
MLAGATLLSAASPALADSAEYFALRSTHTEVPALLPQSDRDYYKALFAAIDKEDWKTVQSMFDQRKDGPLHKVALAEFYLSARSPKVEASQLEDWFRGAPPLPEAEKLARMGQKRGLTNLPSLPSAQNFYRQPTLPKRTRPSAIDDGTVSAALRAGILDRIDKDDPDGARLLLDAADAGLSTDARAELRQRIAWSYYIENRDPDALAMARTVDEGTGPWVAEGDWVAGLAAWRTGDCNTSLDGFERAGRGSTNNELTAAAHYWASRAATRCRMPDRSGEHLKAAAQLDQTLYGMLAAEQLGTTLPQRFAKPDFDDHDWNKLQDKEPVRVAIELTEIGRDDLASQVLLYQAKIGDASDYEPLSRLARGLGLPATQLYMANNAPMGGQADPAARFPAPRWMPVTGWQVDPALAFAHALQESNFQTAVVSPAQAKGLMQITPITVREHAPSLNLSAPAVDLTDPRVNLAFGQQNLEMLRDAPATGGYLPKIMAAYNAGLAPVTRWNTQINDQGDPLLWMESIPYWETRSYVAIVMRNYWMYERQANSDSPSRKALASGKWPTFPGQPSSGRVWLSAKD